MKRVVDIFGATIGLIVLSPLVIYIAWRVYIDVGTPILFRQIRPGKNGKPFQMVKFRSMTETLDQSGAQAPDAQRISVFGKRLRSSSLDEIPELYNVLKGDMSLVGPRPLLTDYLTLYSNEQARRHEIRPGITGWAQINGRNAINWEEKLALDVWYVDNRTIWLDIKILFMTVRKVLIREGISENGEATMSKFTGKNQ